MLFSFYCRQSKADRHGESPIEISLVYDNKRTYIALPRRYRADLFKKDSTKRKGELVEYLATVRAKFNAIETQLLQDGMPLTPSMYKEYFLNGGHRKCDTVCDYLEKAMKQVAQSCTTNRTSDTYKKYCLVRRDFEDYLKEEKINFQSPVTVITQNTITGFQLWLLGKYNSTTVAGKMTKFKCIMSKRTWDTPLFANIKNVKKTVEVQYLTETEVILLKNRDFHNDRLNRVRDLFIFQCGSGLAYSDMASLKKEDVKEEDGTWYVSKPRVKTLQTYTAILLEDALKIWQKYDGELPVISNQRYNSYLKEIQDLAMIDKPLHTHVGRHTYATRLLNRGVRLETVSKCLGHCGDLKATRIYAKILEETVISEVAKVVRA